jgi:O-antigen ligase
MALAVLLGAVAFALLVVVFARSAHVMAAVIVVFLATQPILRDFVSSSFGPAKDVLVIAAVVAAGWWLVFGGVQRRRIDAWLLAGVAALLVVYAVNPAGAHGEAWFHATRLVVEAFLLLIVGCSTPDPRRTWRWTLVALGVSAAGIAIWGLVQQQIGLFGLVDLGYVYDEQIRLTASGDFRSFGTFDDPFNYAAFLAIALTALVLARRRPALLALLVPLLVAGIAVSFVRTSLAFLPVLLLLALLQGRRTLGLVAVLGALLAGVVLFLAVSPPDPPSRVGTGRADVIITLNGRTEGWAKILDTPRAAIAGRGVGELGTGAARAQAATQTTQRNQPSQQTNAQHQRYNIDSSYFALAADIGVVGLLLVLAIFARIVTLGLRIVARGRVEGWVVLGLVLEMAVDSLTRTSLTSFPVGFIGLFVLGVALSAGLADRPQPRLSARTPSPG